MPLDPRQGNKPLALLNKDNHFVGKIKEAFGGNLACNY
jgi:hypothetical protein